jgi:hypothetical protein
LSELDIASSRLYFNTATVYTRPAATQRENAVHLGVWMSEGVWRHKRHGEGRVQAWNLRELPEGFAPAHHDTRLYVAIRGRWRGYFVLKAFSWNPADTQSPITLIFEPRTWSSIEPVPAPPRNRRSGYTLDVPAQNESLQQGNETDPSSLKGRNETKGTRRRMRLLNET